MGISKRSAAQRAHRQAEEKARCGPVAKDWINEEETELSASPREDNPSDMADLADVTWTLRSPDDVEPDTLPAPKELIQFFEGEVANSLDEEDCTNNLEALLFPVFTRPCPSTTTLGKCRNPITGKPIRGYKQPAPHPNSHSKKLFICVPRSTQFHCKKPLKKKLENERKKGIKPTPSITNVFKPADLAKSAEPEQKLAFKDPIAAQQSDVESDHASNSNLESENLSDSTKESDKEIDDNLGAEPTLDTDIIDSHIQWYCPSLLNASILHFILV